MTTRLREVVVCSGAGYRNTVTSRTGTVTSADEPVDAGGQGAGFGPFELVAAGLGACTAITLKMYAERKQWPLRQVRVALQYVRAGEQGTQVDGPDLIRRGIELCGPLDAAQRERLAAVAARCPVAKALGRGAATIVDRLTASA